jgi:outer membrane receptor protein involved in Fe transport
VSLGGIGRHRIRVGGPEEFFDGRYSENGEGNFLLSRDRSGGNYTAEDRISAGYVMADVAIGSRLRVVGGARLEHSDLKLDYESQVGAAGTARPSYSDVLPSLSLSLDLTASPAAPALGHADAGPAGVPGDRPHRLPGGAGRRAGDRQLRS